MSHETSIQLDVGTRVTVYWSDDDQWYKGSVAALDTEDENCFLIEYDDGDTDWMNTATAKWRASSKPDTFYQA
jgi:hypothetical protein